MRGELQLVFQDPNACLDPRMTIAESVAEPLRSLAPDSSPAARTERVSRILDEVGLPASLTGRYPHQLSGGQLQRAVIARALVVDPSLVVCDEPVSALDVSIQGQIVNLIARIRRDRGLACLFISHNLAVVASLAERMLVMYRGRIVESGARQSLLDAPLHPYTRLLIDSVPDVDPARARRLLSRRAARPCIRRSPRPRAARSSRAVRWPWIVVERWCRRCAILAMAARSPAIARTNGGMACRRRSQAELGQDHLLSQTTAHAANGPGKPTREFQ